MSADLDNPEQQAADMAVPAWPMTTHPRPGLQPFDWLWCSLDNSVRVAGWQGKFYVSIKGDNFCGPFKTEAAARQYGVSA